MEAIQQKIQTGVSNYLSLLQEIVSDFGIFFTGVYTTAKKVTQYLPATTDFPAFLQTYIALLRETYDELRHAMATDTVPSFFIPTVVMLLAGSSSLFFIVLIYFTG